jgi:hypothetical protein
MKRTTPELLTLFASASAWLGQAATLAAPPGSVQVNVDSQGASIEQDIAVEPSIAIDPGAPGSSIAAGEQVGAAGVG